MLDVFGHMTAIVIDVRLPYIARTRCVVVDIHHSSSISWIRPYIRVFSDFVADNRTRCYIVNMMPAYMSLSVVSSYSLSLTTVGTSSSLSGMSSEMCAQLRVMLNAHLPTGSRQLAISPTAD